jgi:hypothetical protein
MLLHRGNVVCCSWTKGTTNGTSLLSGWTLCFLQQLTVLFPFCSCIFQHLYLDYTRLGKTSNDMMWNLCFTVNYSQHASVSECASSRTKRIWGSSLVQVNNLKPLNVIIESLLLGFCMQVLLSCKWLSERPLRCSSLSTQILVYL